MVHDAEQQQFKLFSRAKKRKTLSDTTIEPSKKFDTKQMDTAVEIELPADKTSFQELGLGEFLQDALKSLSIHAPTDIQRACIPHILAGKNLIGSAKTGSGKTLTFALPIIQKLSEDPYGVFALILTPTRELAFQIAEQFRAIGESVRLKQAVIVGGMDMVSQGMELAKRPHIVVATPGRLADHIQSTVGVNLRRIKYLVLDEADRLLGDSTFEEPLDTILTHLPKHRQTLLFSATITKGIQQAKSPNMVMYSAHERHDTVAKLDQRLVVVPSLVRDSYLVWVLEHLCKEKTAILFVNKTKTCELLRVMLRELGFNITALHSEMTQQQRINSLARFRAGVSQILLTTDVGGRGLDIPQVQTVVNYDVPCAAVDYVHRVGRTARAGRGGLAITLATEMDMDLISNIEKKVGKSLEAQEIPEKEVHDMLMKVANAKRAASLYLDEINFGEKTYINKMKVLSTEERQLAKKRKKSDQGESFKQQQQ